MANVALRVEVDELRETLSELARLSLRTEQSVNRLSEEMTAFKQEMAEFKDEMVDFKDEMLEFKDETRREHRELNRKWGDMANKLGTIVEDLVAPSLPRIVREVFDEELVDLSVRRKRRLADGRVQEFDAILVTPTQVCLNSTKSTLRGADVDALITEIDRLREFFPEYRETPVVGILATLGVEEGVLSYASRLGFLVLAIGDELMEVQNPKGFVPKRW